MKLVLGAPLAVGTASAVALRGVALWLGSPIESDAFPPPQAASGAALLAT